MYRYFLRRDLFCFIVVGGIGFCIDGGFLTILMQREWDVIPARLLSFLLAVSCTWILNRFWTFNKKKTENIKKEYAHYFIIQVLGVMINLSIFFLLISLYSILQKNPLVALALGASVSLVFNYLLSRYYVFKR